MCQDLANGQQNALAELSQKSNFVYESTFNKGFTQIPLSLCTLFISLWNKSYAGSNKISLKKRMATYASMRRKKPIGIRRVTRHASQLTIRGCKNFLKSTSGS